MYCVVLEAVTAALKLAELAAGGSCGGGRDGGGEIAGTLEVGTAPWDSKGAVGVVGVDRGEGEVAVGDPCGELPKITFCLLMPTELEGC